LCADHQRAEKENLMAASVGIEYDGLKQALREIQKVDPALRRQITKDIKSAADPLVSAIKDSIPSSPPLTGQKHSGRTAWKNESKNIVVKVDTRKARKRNISAGAEYESISTVRITAKGAALSMSDMAGRGPNQSRNSNPLRARPGFAGYLTASLGRGPSRFVWARSDDYLDEITRNVDKIVIEVMDKTNKSLVKR
jgi:hypothetical protein